MALITLLWVTYGAFLMLILVTVPAYQPIFEQLQMKELRLPTEFALDLAAWTRPVWWLGVPLLIGLSWAVWAGKLDRGLKPAIVFTAVLLAWIVFTDRLGIRLPIHKIQEQLEQD